MMMDVQKSIAVLSTKVDRVLDDRKDDRAEHKTAIADMRSDLKEFREKDFKELRSDVVKLRISWARILGAAAVAGAIVSFVAEYLKSKLLG